MLQVTALRRADHSSKERPTVCVEKSYELEEEARAQQRALEPFRFNEKNT
jgi:hypothetical protein